MNNIERKALLESLMAKIRDEKSPSNRELKRALTEEEWAKYEKRAETYKPVQKMPEYLLQGLLPYLTALRKADSLDHQADVRSRKWHLPREEHQFCGLYPTVPVRSRAEFAYERALGKLAEAIDSYGALDDWFDRPINLDESIDLAPEGPPRLRTSRSPHTLHNGQTKLSKRALISLVVQDSLYNLETQSQATSEMATFGYQSADSDELDDLDWSDDPADDFGIGNGMV